MEIIEGNLAKNLIVIGNWSDKDGEVAKMENKKRHNPIRLVRLK